MGNVIGLREKYVENIEKRAYDEYGVLKMDEDSYIVPSNFSNTYNEIDERFKESELYSDEKLLDFLKQLDIKNDDFISISCKAILPNNRKKIEIINIRTEEIQETIVTSELLFEDREMLVNMICYIQKEKGTNMYATFYLHYDFNLVESLFEGE